MPPTPSRSSRRYRPPMTSRATAVAYAAPVAGLLAMEDAQRLVLEHVRPLPSEEVALAAAAGRVLAPPPRAAVDLPPFARPAMDGFGLPPPHPPGGLPALPRIAPGPPGPPAARRGEGGGGP